MQISKQFIMQLNTQVIVQIFMQFIVQLSPHLIMQITGNQLRIERATSLMQKIEDLVNGGKCSGILNNPGLEGAL
jgi:hypothetical protein